MMFTKENAFSTINSFVGNSHGVTQEIADAAKIFIEKYPRLLEIEVLSSDMPSIYWEVDIVNREGCITFEVNKDCSFDITAFRGKTDFHFCHDGSDFDMLIALAEWIWPKDYDDEISPEQAEAIRKYIEKTGHCTKVSKIISGPAW